MELFYMAIEGLLLMFYMIVIGLLSISLVTHMLVVVKNNMCLSICTKVSAVFGTSFCVSLGIYFGYALLSIWIN